MEYLTGTFTSSLTVLPAYPGENLAQAPLLNVCIEVGHHASTLYFHSHHKLFYPYNHQWYTNFRTLQPCLFCTKKKIAVILASFRQCLVWHCPWKHDQPRKLLELGRDLERVVEHAMVLLIAKGETEWMDVKQAILFSFLGGFLGIASRDIEFCQSHPYWQQTNCKWFMTIIFSENAGYGVDKFACDELCGGEDRSPNMP